MKLEAQRGDGETICSVIHYFLDCIGKVQGGLLFVLAGGEELRRIVSFLELPLSTMSEHSFRIMYIVPFHELLM